MLLIGITIIYNGRINKLDKNKKKGPPKGVTNNPNGRPTGEPKKEIHKRVPVRLYNNCIAAIDNILETDKNERIVSNS